MDVRKKFLHRNVFKALDLTPQGSDRVTIHGTFKNVWIWHLQTWFNGNCGGGPSLRIEFGLGNLEDLFQP